MPRYLKIRASGDGSLTPNPHAVGQRRFAGRRLRPVEADAKPDKAKSLADHYEHVEEILADHADLRAAIRSGHLVLLAETIAPDHAAAARSLASPTPSKPTSASKERQ